MVSVTFVISQTAVLVISNQFLAAAFWATTPYFLVRLLVFLGGIMLNHIVQLFMLNFRPDVNLWTVQQFATNMILAHDMVVNYHEPECHMKWLDCCLYGQGHGKGLSPKEMDVIMSHIWPYLFNHLKLTLYSGTLLWKECLVKRLNCDFPCFKVTASVQLLKEWLCTPLHMNYWTFCIQTVCHITLS